MLEPAVVRGMIPSVKNESLAFGNAAIMIHELPHDIWVRAEALAATGDFKSELDAIRTGLSILEHRRADLAAIEEGLADLKAGRTKSLAQFNADFCKRHNISLEE